MLEVLFSDSEKGSMKVAKNYNAKAMLGGSIGYIGKKPTKAELEKHFEGQAVGGSSQDVVNIGFSLDIGDISGEIDGNERQNVFRKLWGRFDFDKKEQEQFFQNQRKDMEKLLSAAKDGMPIRIWKSSAPYSSCGFHFVCNLLRNIDCNIRVVSLPKYNPISENEILKYSHWGEVAAGKFYQFLSLEKQLTKIEKRIIGDRWHHLMVENAPLRAILNGKLTSVPENFYDFIIMKNLPDNDFIMARFIGKLLGEYRLGISDSWYALRIDKMIEENKLIVVENKNPSHPYGKVNWYNHVKVGLDMKFFWKQILRFVPALIAPVLAGILINSIFNLYNIFYFLGFGIIYVIIFCGSIWFVGMNQYEKDLIGKPIRSIVRRIRK